MVYILTSVPDSPRLQYICGVLFGLILETEYQLVSNIESLPQDAAAVIDYAGQLRESLFCIPANGLLYETGIEKKDIQVVQGTVPMLLMGQESLNLAFSIPFDLFSAAFYFITEYYYYTETQFDTHGRYIEANDPLTSFDLHSQPLLHIYAEYLWEQLSRKYTGLERRQRKFSYQFTFDIDAPYLFQYRPLWLQAAGLAKDMLKGDIASLRKRIGVYMGAQDPYDTYAYIRSKLSPEEAVFFFLINRRSPHDDRYTFEHKAYRRLIMEISEAGYPVGIHPSYTSFLEGGLIRFEKEKLEEIIGRPTELARMHFLKYRLPDTYRHLLEAGIREDYTSCMVRDAGYRHFIALPFPWFDLAANRQTALTIHPAIAMDRSLESYAGLHPEEALEKLKHYISLTAKYQGCFIMLMHNTSLSEFREWVGWRKVFEESLVFLREQLTT